MLKKNRFSGDWLFPLVALVATIVVWHGAIRSGFTPDDYMVIDVQSPIRSFIDVISMFWRHDPNPQYWRPLTDSSVSFDFLVWGYDPHGFHITNLVLHCIATALAYNFIRRIFQLSHLRAGITALLFGVSASHDSNLLWIAARSDVIATIMMLVCLLSARKWEIQRAWWWIALSYFSFFLALCSKEVSGVTLALLPLMIYSSSAKELWEKKRRIIIQLLPYVGLTAIFIFIRLQFTVPLSEMQPLSAEGSHSLAAFMKNALYSIGYIIAPIDFSTASAIINKYSLYGYLAAALFAVLAIVIAIQLRHSSVFSKLWKPILFTIVTGLVSFQSFERWRVYSPSIALYSILVLVGFALYELEKLKSFRPYLVATLMLMILFYSEQSIRSHSVWEESTKKIERMKNDVETILSDNTKRPITLHLLTSPIKLGGAPILQLSNSYLSVFAEAERKELPGMKYGSLGNMRDSVGLYTDLDVYALDPKKGFQSYVVKKISADELEIYGDENEIGMMPNTPIEGGVARRDRVLKVGETYEADGATITILKAQGAFASHVKVKVKDTLSLPVYFDGVGLRELNK
jgi:hypothetical protein